MDATSILVSQLKNRPSSFVMERLRQAEDQGIRVLDVINRARPVCHLALAEEMPVEWRATEPGTVPLNELKRSQISITQLRREGRALFLAQRSGPTLALWPVEDDYSRPADLSLSDRVLQLERDNRDLRRRVRDLERLGRQLAAFGELMAKTFAAPRQAAEEDGGRGATEEDTEPEAAS